MVGRPAGRGYDNLSKERTTTFSALALFPNTHCTCSYAYKPAVDPAPETRYPRRTKSCVKVGAADGLYFYSLLKRDGLETNFERR